MMKLATKIPSPGKIDTEPCLHNLEKEANRDRGINSTNLYECACE